MSCIRWRGFNFYTTHRMCTLTSRIRRIEDDKLSVIVNFTGKRKKTETNDTVSSLILILAIWIIVRKLNLTFKNVRRLIQDRSSSTTIPTMWRTTRCREETRSLTDRTSSTEADKEEKRPKNNDFSMYCRRSHPVAQDEVSYASQVRMENTRSRDKVSTFRAIENCRENH